MTVNNWGYRLEPKDGGTLVTEYFRLDPNLPTRAYWLLLGPAAAADEPAGHAHHARADEGGARVVSNREAMLEKLADLDAQHAVAVAGGGQKYVDRHHARGKLTARERIELLVDPGLGLPRAVAAGGLGLRLHRRRVPGDRHRRGRGRRVPDHRQRPDGQGRREQPVDGEEGLPGRADRRGEQPPDDLARRVRRRRPADAEGDLHPRRPALPRPHPVVGPQAADDRAGLRQLDRRRGLRPRDERLHRVRPRRRQGLPRRSAAGEDGDRRGVRRRVARRRRDARPGLRPGRLPRRGRARRDPDRAPDRGSPEPRPSESRTAGLDAGLRPLPASTRPSWASPSPTPTPRASSTSSPPTSRSRSTRAR